MRTRNVVVPVVFLVVLGGGCETVVTETDTISMPKTKKVSYEDRELERLEALIGEYPKRHDYIYRKAGFEFYKKNFRESAALLRRAIDLKPTQVRYHYHLGRVYLNMGELELAEESFERADEMTPNERHSGPRCARAYVYALRGKLVEATSLLKDVVANEPENTEAYYLLGALHDMQGDQASAIRYFREYLQRGGKRYRTRTVGMLEDFGVEVDLERLEKQADLPSGERLPLGLESHEVLPGLPFGRTTTGG